MAEIRGLMACSLDGFVADAAGGVGWLEPWHGVDWGFAAFVAEIGTVVMGRRNYYDACALSADWPYPGKRAIVLTSRPLEAPRGGAEVWSGDLQALAADLRQGTGDAWVVGGPGLQADLIAMGALDRLQICLVPILLGRGLRLFPDRSIPPSAPELSAVTPLAQGLVLLDYRFGSFLGGCPL
jgi:dihydrofolate reductase